MPVLSHHHLGLGSALKWLFLSLCLLLLQSCVPAPSSTQPINEPASSSPAVADALVNFKVEIPENTPADQGIYLTILDDVTGMSLNPKRYLMRANDRTHYMLTLPIPVGTVVKYRYSRQTQPPAEEYTSGGYPVQFRIYQVIGPGVVQDIVARWIDVGYSGKLGSLHGKASETVTGKPIAGLVVECSGIQVETAADGTYFISGLPAGLQNMAVYTRNGSYRIFQQGAVINENATTQASFEMVPVPMVNTVFSVTVPPETPSNAVIRLAGSLSQTGNTYKNLALGANVDVNKMPQLMVMGERRYGVSIQLPVGADLHYKYTLGDGFWNAERNADFSIRVRQLIVPNEGQIIEDQIITWSDGTKTPRVFTVKDTHPSMNIQFNFLGWTQPIPAWPREKGGWSYTLFSPLSFLDSNFEPAFCYPKHCN